MMARILTFTRARMKTNCRWQISGEDATMAVRTLPRTPCPGHLSNSPAFIDDEHLVIDGGEISYNLSGEIDGPYVCRSCMHPV
jgi:hypothetical protein